MTRREKNERPRAVGQRTLWKEVEGVSLFHRESLTPLGIVAQMIFGHLGGTEHLDQREGITQKTTKSWMSGVVHMGGGVVRQWQGMERWSQSEVAGHRKTWGFQNIRARVDLSTKAAESENEKPSGVQYGAPDEVD